MKKHQSILLLMLALGLSAVINLRAESSVIAKIGNEEIQTDTIRPYLENLSVREKSALERNPALLSQAVRTLILQQILLKEALASGWEKQPGVAEQIERIRKAAIAETYLQTITKVPEGYPSEAELLAVYNARKDGLLIPKQYRLAQIFVPSRKGAEKAEADKGQAKIDAIYKSVKQTGADFSAVARAQSEEVESASRGGEIGWLAESAVQPEIRKRVASLAKNGISEPMRFEDGWYILKVIDIKDAHIATLDEVRTELIQAMRAERVKLNREAYLSKLQQQNPMAIDELTLTKLLNPEKK